MACVVEGLMLCALGLPTHTVGDAPLITWNNHQATTGSNRRGTAPHFVLLLLWICHQGLTRSRSRAPMAGRYDSNPFDEDDVNPFTGNRKAPGQSNYGGGSFYTTHPGSVPPASNSRLSPLPLSPSTSTMIVMRRLIFLSIIPRWFEMVDGGAWEDGGGAEGSPYKPRAAVGDGPMYSLPDSMKHSQVDLYMETYQVLDLD